MLRTVLEGRDVEFSIVDGHSAATPSGHRAADLLCRYGMIRLAAGGGDELALDAADLRGHLGGAGAATEVLARACAGRLAELGIYDEDQGDGGPKLDWRSGGFEVDGFGVSTALRRIHRLEHLISWAERRGELETVMAAECELAELLAKGCAVEAMAVPNYRASGRGGAPVRRRG